MKTTIHFYGGAGAVTGANFLVDTGESKVLVDCGLRQGMREESNWDPFAYDLSSVTHLFVTHAHIDHIGRIPWLVKQGFSGRIVSTSATRALAEPLLHDAMSILAQEAEHSGREQLYGEADITRAMGLWDTLAYHAELPLPGGVMVTLFDAGHILGSAMVRFARGGKSLVFSGDLGGGNSPLLPKAEAVTGATYLVMESVYGDRVREDDHNRREQLEDVIENTSMRGGTLLIPAFSTERTQDLLFEIRTLMVEQRVPQMSVYVDSPLAQKITQAFVAHPEFFAEEIRARIAEGEDIFAFPQLHFVEDAKASHALSADPTPKIIIAGSGMSAGGRVLGHERVLLPDEKSTLLIVGYQAAGGIGRRLIEGEKSLRIQRETIPVRARIETLYGYSAHMDGEQLLEFANETARGAQEIFVVMGEPASATFLAQRIRDYLGVKATTPESGESVEVDL